MAQEEVTEGEMPSAVAALLGGVGEGAPAPAPAKERLVVEPPIVYVFPDPVCP